MTLYTVLRRKKEGEPKSIKFRVSTTFDQVNCAKHVGHVSKKGIFPNYLILKGNDTGSVGRNLKVL